MHSSNDVLISVDSTSNMATYCELDQKNRISISNKMEEAKPDESVQYDFGQIPSELVYKMISDIADPTLEDFMSTALKPVLHSSFTATVPSPPTHTNFERPITTHLTNRDIHNDEKPIVQYNFGEIPFGLVSERIRYIADPTWEDFSSTAPGPVLHLTNFECPTATHKSIAVSSSNSLYYMNTQVRMLSVHTENSVCVYYIFDVTQDDENRVLPLLHGSDHEGDWIKGRQFRSHFCFGLTRPGLAYERINLYITGPTCEDYSLRPALELINYSSTTFVSMKVNVTHPLVLTVNRISDRSTTRAKIKEPNPMHESILSTTLIYDLSSPMEMHIIIHPYYPSMDEFGDYSGLYSSMDAVDLNSFCMCPNSDNNPVHDFSTFSSNNSHPFGALANRNSILPPLINGPNSAGFISHGGGANVAAAAALPFVQNIILIVIFVALCILVWRAVNFTIASIKHYLNKITQNLLTISYRKYHIIL